MSGPVENIVTTEPKEEVAASSEEQKEFMHKRKAYRLEQESKRKVLKTVKFDENNTDDAIQLPRVSSTLARA